MAELLCRGSEIEYTILPYDLETPIEEEIKKSTSTRTLGYVTRDKNIGQFKIVYQPRPGYLPLVPLELVTSVLKKFPSCKECGPWIVYAGTPEDAGRAYNEILTDYGQTVHIHEWDTWNLKKIDTIVAVVTSWETY